MRNLKLLKELLVSQYQTVDAEWFRIAGFDDDYCITGIILRGQYSHFSMQ